MSIDHGKVLDACRRKLEAYRDAYGLGYVGGQELSSLLADIDRALAQPAEPDDIAESAKKIVSELPRYFHEVRGSYVHWGVFPAKHKDGEWVKWSDVESGAFIEALIRLQSTPTANTAQPTEAVEGVIEIMRGVVADMALSVPRQSKTVNQELVFAWHERLSNAYQELRRLTTTAGGDNVHDAAQGAVAWRYRHPVDGDIGTWHDVKDEPVNGPYMQKFLAEGCDIEYAYTHPQAAPAQGDGVVVYAALQAKLGAVTKDAERLDALERELAARGPIVLHNGEGTKGGYRGLGLANTNRSLRQAIDECCALTDQGRAGEEAVE